MVDPTQPKRIKTGWLGIFLKLIQAWRRIQGRGWRGIFEFHLYQTYTAHTSQTKLVEKLLEVNPSLEENLRVRVE
jgi:hypothetical protein